MSAATANDTLANAIAYLTTEALGADQNPAVEVEPGFWAYASFNPKTSAPCWRVATTVDLEKLAAELPRGEDDAPPEWVMDEAIMPSKATHGWDWTPEQRFARRCIHAEDCVDDQYVATEAEASALAHNDAICHYERITASLEEESKRIVESAEQEIAMAAAQARRGLRTFAADLAIDQAAQKLVLTAENDRALIAEFVGDVLRKGTPAGGKS